MKPPNKEPEEYSQAIAAATLLLAKGLVNAEKNSTRQEKLRSVMQIKLDLFYQAFSSERRSDWADAQRNFLQNALSKQKAVMLIIDLSFANPFAPYELKFKDSDLKTYIKTVAAVVGVSNEKVDSIFRTRTDANKVHRRISYGTLAVVTVVGVLVIATGAWFAAPLIGTAMICCRTIRSCSHGT